MKHKMKRIVKNHPRFANALFSVGTFGVLAIDFIGTHGNGTLGP